MSNLKVHMVYNGEPCLVLSLSNMVKHDFGKVWQEPSRFVKDWPDMSWHFQVLSCHEIIMMCHGNVMTKNLVMVFVMVTSHFVTVTAELSSWQKKTRDNIKKTCQHTDRKIEKKGAFGPHYTSFFCHGQKSPFSVTVCHGDKPWQLYDKPWQTVTNHDKPWQTHDKTMTTMTNLDNTMTNLDNTWQYHDKPWQSSWQTLIFHDNTM